MKIEMGKGGGQIDIVRCMGWRACSIHDRQVDAEPVNTENGW